MDEEDEGLAGHGLHIGRETAGAQGVKLPLRRRRAEKDVHGIRPVYPGGEMGLFHAPGQDLLGEEASVLVKAGHGLEGGGVQGPGGLHAAQRGQVFAKAQRGRRGGQRQRVARTFGGKSLPELQQYPFVEGIVLAADGIPQHGMQVDGNGRTAQDEDKQLADHHHAAAPHGGTGADPEAEGKQEQAVGQQKGRRQQAVEVDGPEAEADAYEHEDEKQRQRQEERQISGVERGLRPCVGRQPGAAGHRCGEAETDDCREERILTGRAAKFRRKLEGDAVILDEERAAFQDEKRFVQDEQVQEGAERQDKHAHGNGRGLIPRCSRPVAGGPLFSVVPFRPFPCVTVEAEGKQEPRIQQGDGKQQQQIEGPCPRELEQGAELLRGRGDESKHEERQQRGEEQGGYGASPGRFGGQPATQGRHEGDAGEEDGQAEHQQVRQGRPDRHGEKIAKAAHPHFQAAPDAAYAHAEEPEAQGRSHERIAQIFPRHHRAFSFLRLYAIRLSAKNDRNRT